MQIDVIGQTIAPFELAQPVVFAPLGDRKTPGFGLLAQPAMIRCIGNADLADEGEVVAPDLTDPAIKQQSPRPARFSLRAAQYPHAALAADMGMPARVPVNPLQGQSLVDEQALTGSAIEYPRGLRRAVLRDGWGCRQCKGGKHEAEFSAMHHPARLSRRAAAGKQEKRPAGSLRRASSSYQHVRSAAYSAASPSFSSAIR